MHLLSFLLSSFALLIASVSAQTITTTDANADTIVVVVTTNPLGLPTTQTLLTLPPTDAPDVPSTTSSSSTTTQITPPGQPPVATTSPTTTPPTTLAATTATTARLPAVDTTVQHGPVGQPDPTTGTPGGPTPYRYTTVVGGVTTVLTDIFTPTSPETVRVTPTLVGSILDYSQWLSKYGPQQTANATTVNGGMKNELSLTMSVLTSVFAVIVTGLHYL